MPDRKPTLSRVLKAGLRRPPQRSASESAEVTPPLKRALQAFQLEMLQDDYADLIADPQYSALARFLFSAVYAPKDFGHRNDSFRALHEWLVGLIGRDPVQVLARSIELYELTESLDDDMVFALRRLAGDHDITMPAWEQAYRLVDRRPDRERQVELFVQVGATLELPARVPFVNLQLRAVRPVAALIGWGYVVDFLIAGQEALAQAHPIEPALRIIRKREAARIRRLLP